MLGGQIMQASFFGSTACVRKREADNAGYSSQPRILAEVTGPMKSESHNSLVVAA